MVLVEEVPSVGDDSVDVPVDTTRWDALANQRPGKIGRPLSAGLPPPTGHVVMRRESLVREA